MAGLAKLLFSQPLVVSICVLLLLQRHLIQAALVTTTLELCLKPDVEHSQSLVVRDKACWHTQYI